MLVNAVGTNQREMATTMPRRSLELTAREYRWAASLMERVEHSQRDLDPPDTGLEL